MPVSSSALDEYRRETPDSRYVAQVDGNGQTLAYSIVIALLKVRGLIMLTTLKPSGVESLRF